MDTPRISIVTATYNRADFLEATIQSILQQNYPNLEYIIIDGGSTDGTVDIIKQYEDQLAYWVSEPDDGMYRAIQKGFDRATGDILAWLNSDDLYFDWTFSTLAQIFTERAEVEWLTTNQVFIINEDDAPLVCYQIPGYSQEGYHRAEHFPGINPYFAMDYIMQESTFWRRSLWEKAGSKLDLSLKYAGDAELWFRFFEHATLYDVSLPLAKFRTHENQITSSVRDQYEAEIKTLLQRYGGKLYNPLTHQARKFAYKHTPFRIRRIAYWLGLMHQSKRLKYSLHDKVWEIQQRYY